MHLCLEFLWLIETWYHYKGTVHNVSCHTIMSYSSWSQHRGQRSSIDRFSLRKWCKPTALYSKLRMSSLYIDLHDAYRRTRTSQACESWRVYYIIERDETLFLTKILLPVTRDWFQEFKPLFAGDVMFWCFLNTFSAIVEIFLQTDCSQPGDFIQIHLFRSMWSGGYWWRKWHMLNGK